METSKEFEIFMEDNPDSDEIKFWVVAHSDTSKEFIDFLNRFEEEYDGVSDFVRDMQSIMGISKNAFTATIMRTCESVEDHKFDKSEPIFYRLDFGELEFYKRKFSWFKKAWRDDDMGRFDFLSIEELVAFWTKFAKKNNINIVFPIPYSDKIRDENVGYGIGDIIDEEVEYDGYEGEE